MSFNEKGYLVIRNLISEEEIQKLNTHLNNRDDANLTCSQAIGTPSLYGDEEMKKTQIKLLPKIEEYSGLKLFKTYSFARIYKKGDILRIHTDRVACEISVTLDLGGDKWPIWLLDKDENPIEIHLNPGDALIYKGIVNKHWRGKFNGNKHTQIFIHYVDKFGPYYWAKDDIFKEKP